MDKLSQYNGSVVSYTIGILTMRVNFPVDYVGCQACPFRRRRYYSEGKKRTVCTQTYENLDGIDMLRERGQDCPLEIETVVPLKEET